MKIAILADSHEHEDNLLQALKTVQEMQAEVLLFAGDFCSPKMCRLLVTNFVGQIHAIFGNNDGDKFAMARIAKDYSHMTLYGDYAAFELGGKRIGMTHYPFYAGSMMRSRDYDLVVFGHDHIPRIERMNGCLGINPGSLDENQGETPCSFAIYDSATHSAQLHGLDGGILTIEAV